MITMFSPEGHHYVAKIYHAETYYLYDGLKTERMVPTSKDNPVQNYVASTCLYVKMI